jgi:hypothetical protein
MARAKPKPNPFAGRWKIVSMASPKLISPRRGLFATVPAVRRGAERIVWTASSAAAAHGERNRMLERVQRMVGAMAAVPIGVRARCAVGVAVSTRA